MMAAPGSDEALLERWRGGDEEASAAILARYYGPVLRFFEVKLSFVAEDLTQATFVACLEKADTAREARSFRSYLFGIARNVYLKHQRKDGRLEAAMRFQDFGAQRPRTTASALVVRKEEQELILRALVDLSDDQLMVIQLHYWDGLSTEEVADVLSIPASTVTSRLARARSLLARRVQQVASGTALRRALLANLDDWTRSLARPDV